MLAVGRYPYLIFYEIDDGTNASPSSISATHPAIDDAPSAEPPRLLCFLLEAPLHIC